jgi:small GTP-binding protein
MTTNLEAKICVLGAQGMENHNKKLSLIQIGVGKTSLVQRYVYGTFTPSKTTSTIGASFLTKRTVDIDSGSTVRLQVWDTAGQERFHSITKLYYRGASAVILVYSIIDENSFKEMGRWLQEVKENLGNDIILHVVGTKADLVAQDPSLRQIPFERCIAYVAENLHPTLASTPPPSAGSMSGFIHNNSPSNNTANPKRHSGFWGNDIGWDVCHEISASSGEGIEEVFRVITRKLVEKSTKRHDDPETPLGRLSPPGDTSTGYFDRAVTDGIKAANGSFRLGALDKRRSWLLGFPTPSIVGDEVDVSGAEVEGKRKKAGCC